jgi:SAM-dependent methyltransferase
MRFSGVRRRFGKILRGIRRRLLPAHMRQGRTRQKRLWDRIYRENSALAASNHYGIPDAENRRDFEIRRALFAELMKRYGPPGGYRALDAGCGPGLFTRELVRKGFDVTAVDFSREALRHAKGLLGRAAKWRRGRLESLRLHRSFSLVICMSVLMCITSDEEHRTAVTNLERHLRPTGVLIIEELLVEPGSEPPPGKDCRFRTMEVYQELAEELRLDLVDHVSFHIPGANQDKCFLVFTPHDGVGADTGPLEAL